ncbi:MAG TPA: MFS transporter [Candidatus Limnocylindrales bacterium]
MSAPALGASDGVATARSGELFAPGYRGLSAGLVSTITLIAVESLAIGTVMPIVVRELGDQELYGWIYAAFYLGNMLGISLVGPILDRVPVRLPFATGLVLYAVGLLAAGIAPSMPILIAARFVQGCGGGTLTPTSYVAIGRRLPQHLQPPMFALLSAAWVVPGLVGPSIAALVGATVGWRWVFLGLLPLLALAGLVALHALGSVPGAKRGEADPEREAMTRRVPFALLSLLGAGLVIAALTAPEPPVIIAGTAVGLVLLVPAFRRLTPPGTLRVAQGVPAAVLLRGAMTFSFFAADGFLALLLQTWRGTTPALTGIVFTVTTIAWSVATWLQARRIDRWGVVRFTRLGFALLTVGALLSVAAVSPAVPPEILAVTWILAGCGMGVMYSAATLVVLRRSRPSEQGSATSSLQLADILGTALGVGAGGAITAAGTRAGGDGLGWALAATFLVTTAVAVLGLLASGRLGDAPPTGSAKTAAVD